MKDTIDLISKLITSKPGECINYSGAEMSIINTVHGCDGCVFATEQKANGCNLKFACMAHYRKDKESVVFTHKIH